MTNDNTEGANDPWPWVIDNRRFVIIFASLLTSGWSLVFFALSISHGEPLSSFIVIGTSFPVNWLLLVSRAGVWRITPTAILYVPFLSKPRWIAFADVAEVSLDRRLILYASRRVSTPALSSGGKNDIRHRERMLATWLDEWFDMTHYFHPPPTPSKRMKRAIAEWVVMLLVITIPMLACWWIGVSYPDHVWVASAALLLWPTVLIASILHGVKWGVFQFDWTLRRYYSRRKAAEPGAADAKRAMRYVRSTTLFGIFWTVVGGFFHLLMLAVAAHKPDVIWTVIALVWGVLFWMLTFAWVQSAWSWWRWALAVSRRCRTS